MLPTPVSLHKSGSEVTKQYLSNTCSLPSNTCSLREFLGGEFLDREFLGGSSYTGIS